MPEIAFTVPGHPTAWARARTGKGRFFKSKAQEQASASAQSAFTLAAPNWHPWEGPVHLALTCHFLAPKDFWEGCECTKRPDLDNLCKLVGDALNGVAYRDDSQIVAALIQKRFSRESERTDVRLTFLAPVEKPRRVRPPAAPRKRKAQAGAVLEGL